MLVLRIVEDVERQQRHRLLARVLPPMRRPERFPGYIAGLVEDRDRAVAAVFDDLAFDDIDERRAVIVAVPGNDAIGLDYQLANPHLAAVGLDRFVGEIDRGEYGVGNAEGRNGHRLADVRLALTQGASPGMPRGGENGRRRDGARHNHSPPEPAANQEPIEHRDDLLCCAFQADEEPSMAKDRTIDRAMEMPSRFRFDRDVLSR